MKTDREIIEDLVSALYAAVPFVEDAEYSTDFKRGYVTRIINQISDALLDAREP